MKLRIFTDLDHSDIIHAVDLDTGIDINNSILSGTLHMERGHITATLEVLVHQVDVITHDVTLSPYAKYVEQGVYERVDEDEQELIDPPFAVRVLDRRDADEYVDDYLDWNTPIPWWDLTDIGKHQAQERLKDEACDPYNITYRGHRVSKALIALVESHRYDR